jgi:hypothetical protein
MGSVHRKSKHRTHLEPIDWPDWTDEVRWELGPDPDDAGPYEQPTEQDREWAAANLNDDGCLFPDDDVIEQMSREAEAQARLERGYCP